MNTDKTMLFYPRSSAFIRGSMFFWARVSEGGDAAGVWFGVLDSASAQAGRSVIRRHVRSGWYSAVGRLGFDRLSELARLKPLVSRQRDWPSFLGSGLKSNSGARKGVMAKFCSSGTGGGM